MGEGPSCGWGRVIAVGWPVADALGSSRRRRLPPPRRLGILSPRTGRGAGEAWGWKPRTPKEKRGIEEGWLERWAVCRETAQLAD